jgi:DNA-binding IclR family transcriptional regulator
MRYNYSDLYGVSDVESPGSAVPKTSSVQSIERAIAILKAFSTDKEELGVTELSRQLDLHKSTVSRLLASLQRERLVEENLVTRKYRLGMALVTLGGLVLQRLDVAQMARPLMAALSDTTQETVMLAVKDDVEAINVAQVPSPQMVRHIVWVGRRTPLHCTAVGKVLLAYSPVAEQQAFVNRGLPRYTSNTTTESNTLCQELERVREQGFAIGSEEFEVGLNEIAAPIRDHTGEVVASISVSGPAFRLSPTRFPSVVKQVQHSAHTLSGQLGHTGPNLAQEGGG